MLGDQTPIERLKIEKRKTGEKRSFNQGRGRWLCNKKREGGKKMEMPLKGWKNSGRTLKVVADSEASIQWT